MEDSLISKNGLRTKSLMSLRIEALLDIFSKRAYLTNGISMKEILNELRNNYELETSRKTIYRDIEFINNNLSYNVKYNEKLKIYKISKNRLLDIEDVEIITNAIISSKFYSVNKTRELINKLYDSMGHKRISTIDLDKMVKVEDDYLLNKIELLDKAIKGNKKVKFSYYKTSADNADILSIPNCIVSPLVHIWHEDFYYLLGNFEDSKVSHYRIDRIRDLEILADKRIPLYENSKKKNEFNIGEYINKLVGMSSGKEEIIVLKIKGSYLGRIKDKFGKNYYIINRGDNWNKLSLKVIYNKEFINWILSMGDGIEIMSPEFIRKEVYNQIKNMKKVYEKM